MLELSNRCANIDKKETFDKIKTCFNKTIVERNVIKLNKKIEKKIFIFNYIIHQKNEKSILLLNFYRNRNFVLKFWYENDQLADKKKYKPLITKGLYFITYLVLYITDFYRLL